MIYFITLISAIISGMGIGGGSIFILLCTFFNIYELREAMVYNLAMFIIVGITILISNLKNNLIDKKIFFKMIFFVIFGSLIGVYFGKCTEKDNLKIYFSIFLILLGIYEIISSLINIKKTNNKK